MKQFKTESKKLLDLMINSIYTDREIFLRELISNASDAVDKLHFKSLTDKSLKFSKDSFQINVSFDKKAKTITVSDNGIGMTKEELDENLGTIAHSDSMQFKEENVDDQGDKVDIIGQFGVGFYSCFLVAKKVQVISRSFNSKSEDDAYMWESDGVEGYSIKKSHRAERGTDVIVYLKDDDDKHNYSEYLDQEKLREIIVKYSNYVRYPIKMDFIKSREKKRPEDAGEEYVPEYESYTEEETVNSMIPIWKKASKDVKKSEYIDFYKSNFHDYTDPVAQFTIHAEGAISYDALVYIPGKCPYDLFTKEYKKGLQLYNNNVLIMEYCEDLLPDYFAFAKGVVDSPDFELNISRETLRHDTELLAVSRRIEKKIKAELVKMRDKKRDDYIEFYKNFGRVFKYGIYQSYGAAKDALADLLMFHSVTQDKMITLDEYIQGETVDAKDEKKDESIKAEVVNDTKKVIYYASGHDLDQLKRLPAVQNLIERSIDVLLFTEDIDEFCVSFIVNYNDYEFKNVSGADLDLDTAEEKKKTEKLAVDNKDVLDAIRNAIGDSISKVKISSRIMDAPSCLIAEGPVSFEMERVMAATQGASQIKATRVLEINPKHKVFKVLTKAHKDNDKKKIDLYSKLLYDSALMVEGLPVPDPVEFSKNISKLMV